MRPALRPLPLLVLAVSLAVLPATPLATPLAGQQSGAVPPRAAPPASACAEDDGGLVVPAGFCARVVAEHLGPVRQLAVAPDGTLYAALSSGSEATVHGDVTGGVLVFRDADGDGRVEDRAGFGHLSGNDVKLRAGWIYFATRSTVVRWRLAAGRLEPAGEPEVVVRDLPGDGDHYHKTLAFGRGRTMYVTIGSASNSCQEVNRKSASRGRNPCRELATRAGVWVFDAERAGQTFADGRRFATGLRNASALAVHPVTGALWAAVNGRDQLSMNWGFGDTVNASNPGEELVQVRAGQDYGWPYCYWSVQYARKVLAPEYGGDGRTAGRCARAASPALVFPAHWAPLAMAFVPAGALGPTLGEGLLVAFHGSWNRDPLPQEGYRVSFAPFRDGRPTGRHETFAALRDEPAGLRASGVAVGPDGSVYVAGDRNGKIWRIWRPARQRVRAGLR